jgi:hypothetical protein
MEISLLPGSIVLENIGIQPSNLLQQVPPQQLDPTFRTSFCSTDTSVISNRNSLNINT